MTFIFEFIIQIKDFVRVIFCELEKNFIILNKIFIVYLWTYILNH